MTKEEHLDAARKLEAAADVIVHLGELIVAADAAVNALRSYQYGNASPQLAEEVADTLEARLIPVKLAMVDALGKV
jgi:hypothetical protein